MRVLLVGCEWVWARPVHDIPDQEIVKIKDGYVFLNQTWEGYHPFNFPNLPNRLAHVESTKDITQFVERYGVLGYQELIQENPRLDTYTVGDPVDWFLQQAKTVRFALQLINAVQEDKDEEQIKKLIYSAQVLVPANIFERAKDLPDEFMAKVHCFAEGPDVIFRPVLQPDQWEGKHRLLAIQMASHLINTNSRGVSRVIGLAEEDLAPAIPWQFAQLLNGRSLIEVIWHQVGDAALNPSGKGTRICNECGLPFIVTDKRQKFCPGDVFSSGSLCGTRKRVRELRANKKKKEGG